MKFNTSDLTIIKNDKGNTVILSPNGDVKHDAFGNPMSSDKDFLGWMPGDKVDALKGTTELTFAFVEGAEDIQQLYVAEYK